MKDTKMKEAFIFWARIDANYHKYYHEELDKKILDITMIMLNALSNGFAFLDKQGNDIDYSKAVTKAREDNLKSENFDIYLKVNYSKVRVNFADGKTDEKRNLYGGMDVTLYPMDSVFTKKHLYEKTASLDLVFYANLFIALSDGFMIEYLDAKIIES